MPTETPPPPIVNARGQQRAARLVHWSCQWCTDCAGCEVTEWRFPGPLPRYHERCAVCGQECKRLAQRSMNAARQAERRAADTRRRRPVGRPRKQP